MDSVIETAVGAIDRIRGTAISHNRGHIVKVMGSDSGYLTLMSAIAGGAEVVVGRDAEHIASRVPEGGARYPEAQKSG